MPVPIKPIKDKEENNYMDYSFLASIVLKEQSNKKVITASDSDAKLLYEIWCNSEKKGENTYKISSANSNDIVRLKTKGFLSGDINSINFTKKGKTVITTMALAEPNKFEKKRQEKSYTEILASMNKRGKKGYRSAAGTVEFDVRGSQIDLRKG